MKLRAAATLNAALMLALGGFASTALAGGNGHGGGDHGHGNAPSHQSQPSHQDSSHSQTGDTSGDNSSGVKPSNTTKHDTYEKASSDKTKQYGNGKTAGQIATQAGYGDSTLHGPGNSQPHKVNCGGHEVDVHALKHKRCGAVEGAKHEEHHAAKPAKHEEHAKPKPAKHEEHPKPQPAPSVTFCDMESPTSGKLETKSATEVLKHEFNGTPEEARDIVPPFTYNGQTYSQIWTDANAAIFHNGCNAASPATPQQPKHEDHKVTICHKTGSATNPYVEITVDEHALKNGHTAAKGDIIPAPASGCPTGQVAETTEAQTTTQEQESNCDHTKVVETVVVVGVKHFIGPKGSGRFVIIHPNAHSSHFRDKHPDQILTQTVVKHEVVKGSCPSTTTTERSTTTEVVTTTEESTTTEQSTTTAAAAAAVTPPASTPPASTPPAAAPAGGVLGATAPLHTAKPKPAGGVLGATVGLGRKVGGTTLPFTGLPLWVFALVAGGLILVGAVTRRAGAER